MKFSLVESSALCLAASSVGAFTVVQQNNRGLSHSTRLYDGDGNPPPFGNWGAPAPAPVPTPAPAAAEPAYDYSSWGQPAAATPAPAAPAPYDYSSWGQPAAVAAATSATTVAAPAASPDVTAPMAPAASPAAPVAAAATGDDPIATFAASQQAVVDEIVAAIPDLELKPDFCWDPASTVVGGSAASLEARDAPGAANVAWLANLSIDSKLCSLTIFNGPLTDVPHLLSRVSLVENGQVMELSVDARPRAYGAYETVDANGNYPGPDELGRKAFEYSGARMDYFNKYGTDELKALLDASSQFEGATALEPASDLEAVTGGPLALHVRMPVTPGNVQAVAHVRDGVARKWLQWSLTSEQHRPGAPINTQYVYDAKFRQNCFGALLPVYTQLFGADDGKMVTIGESGPLDEQYVGGEKLNGVRFWEFVSAHFSLLLRKAHHFDMALKLSSQIFYALLLSFTGGS